MRQRYRYYGYIEDCDSDKGNNWNQVPCKYGPKAWQTIREAFYFYYYDVDKLIGIKEDEIEAWMQNYLAIETTIDDKDPEHFERWYKLKINYIDYDNMFVVKAEEGKVAKLV